MHPLSAALRQSWPRSIMVGATDVGGDLAIRFPAHSGAYFHYVASGTCWLRVDGDPASLRLGPGDCVVLPSGRPFLLASDLDLPPLDAEVVFDARANGSIASYQGGGGCMLMAAQRLAEPGTRVSVVAHAPGYASESAFSAAFRRVTGLPPRRYARQTRHPAS